MSSKRSSAKSAAAVPRHVAVVMDGNGRWATRRLLPRTAGHKFGADALKRLVRGCVQHGVANLTVFAFSSENWQRPADEVGALMELFLQALQRETAELASQGVSLRFIGDRTPLQPRMRELMEQAERTEVKDGRLRLNVALNYGGRWDIVQAARAVQEQGLELTEQNLARHMCLADIPEPDLLIRTGGDHRISNFLLWQLAYTELYFSSTLWPDFDEACLAEALSDFARRERRFGRVPPGSDDSGLRVA
ncbi:MAG: di-trans,poly-cis-decaprenylcistransferase [Betaproteobacteria bacterium]|nr:di-trans,poly-cis-decaprenylcistransferase [Betaproteobacteria bacterium]